MNFPITTNSHTFEPQVSRVTEQPNAGEEMSQDLQLLLLLPSQEDRIMTTMTTSAAAAAAATTSSIAAQ